MRPKTIIFNHEKNKQFKKEYQNRIKITDLCQLEGRTLKWQLAYFGPKVGYFGHIF